MRGEKQPRKKSPKSKVKVVVRASLPRLNSLFNFWL